MPGPALLVIVFGLIALIGLVQVVRGIVGVPTFGDPTCRKCRYDLRTFGDRPTACPECGADLAKPGAVRFARRERRPRRIVVGAIVFVLAPVLFSALVLVSRKQMQTAAVLGPGGLPPASNPMWLRQATTADVIGQIPTSAGQPWVWQELSNRHAAGTLTQGEIDASIEALAALIGPATGPAVGPPQFTWSKQYVEALVRSGALSDEAIVTLLEKAYADPPEIDIPRHTGGSRRVRAQIGSMRHDDLIGEEQLMAVREARLDGEVVVLGDFELRATTRQATLTLTDVEPGAHVLEVDVVRHVYPMRGMVQRTNLGPPSAWPEGAVIKREETLRHEFRILAPGETMLELVTDPAREAEVRAAVHARRVHLYRRFGALMAHVDFEMDVVPDLPLAFDVKVVLGDETFDLGGHGIRTHSQSGGTSRSGRNSTTSLTFDHELPADLETCRFILTPAPEIWENEDDVKRIWGGTIEIEAPVEWAESARESEDGDDAGTADGG